MKLFGGCFVIIGILILMMAVYITYGHFDSTFVSGQVTDLVLVNSDGEKIEHVLADSQDYAYVYHGFLISFKDHDENELEFLLSTFSYTPIYDIGDNVLLRYLTSDPTAVEIYFPGELFIGLIFCLIIAVVFVGYGLLVMEIPFIKQSVGKFIINYLPETGGGIVMAIGALFFLLSVDEVFETYQFIRKSSIANATVIGPIVEDGTTPSFGALLSFLDDEGNMFRVKTEMHAQQIYQVGETVKIFYLPSTPVHIKVSKFYELWLGTFYAMALGLFHMWIGSKIIRFFKDKKVRRHQR